MMQERRATKPSMIVRAGDAPFSRNSVEPGRILSLADALEAKNEALRSAAGQLVFQISALRRSLAAISRKDGLRDAVETNSGR